LSLVAILMPFATAPSAVAASIRYEAVDLPQAPGDGDLWLYRYRVDGAVFPAGHGWSVFFDVGLYDQLAAGAAPNADWDVLAIQPDAALVSDGLFDALSLADPASLADPFDVTFLWRGAGTPGAQRFVLYDAATQTLEEGVTTPVPEPATLAALALGLAALALRPSARRERAKAL
jgi:hypothetical protein